MIRKKGRLLTRKINLADETGWLREESVPHAYVASFVIPKDKNDQELGDEDNLIYWLAYGQQGAGCSIRFPIKHNRVKRVLYGKQNAKDAIRKLDLKGLCNCLDPLTNNAVQSFSVIARRDLAKTIWKNLARIAYLYKGDSYQYEQECRLVSSVIDVPGKNVNFDPLRLPSSSHSFRHYYLHDDLKIDQVLVTGSVITLGPLVPRPDNMVYYIDRLLKNGNLSGPRIEISKIPYQGP